MTIKWLELESAECSAVAALIVLAFLFLVLPPGILTIIKL